jgi:DMSO/TMAO reductase YedYZ molybdopterin-dependent catalytic subunit
VDLGDEIKRKQSDVMSMKGERVVYSPDTKRRHRIPPGQQETDSWPVLHYGSVPRLDISKWAFTINGLVETERKLSFEEFQSLPQQKVFSDIHCVTGWSQLDNCWEGVSSHVIADLGKVLQEAKFVVIHAEKGFTANLSLTDFLEPDVLFATKHNGEALAPDHGYPVRLVVPRLYFWKSAKWVTGVEFTAEDRRGFWESRGYHNHGDPWLEERYS